MKDWISTTPYVCGDAIIFAVYVYEDRCNSVCPSDLSLCTLYSHLHRERHHQRHAIGLLLFSLLLTASTSSSDKERETMAVKIYTAIISSLYLGMYNCDKLTCEALGCQ